MLGKVLKYDIKSVFKEISVIYIITIIMALLSCLVNFLATKVQIIMIVASFINFMFYITVIAALFASFVIMIKRFYTNMLKDEGYLTHTLPVKKSTLITSKLITSLIVLILSILVAVVSLAISNFDLLKDIYNISITVLSTTNLPISVIISGTFLLILLAFMEYLLIIYAALSLGSTKNTNRLGHSVIYGIAIYIITQIINVLVLVLVMLPSNNLTNLFTQNTLSIDIMIPIIISVIVLDIIYLFALYFITNKVMSSKLNLE